MGLLIGVNPGSKTAGEWDSIHVFEATDRARMSHYKLTSTVILHLANETESLGDMDLSGNMTRQVEMDLPVESDASHVANVGRLVEDMELKMRNLLRMSSLGLLSDYVLMIAEEVYFGKAKDVVGELRSKYPEAPLTCRMLMAQVLLRCPKRTKTGLRRWR